MSFSDRHPGLFVVLIVPAITASFVVTLVEALARVQCSGYGEATRHTTHYQPFTGCFVETPEGAVPKEVFDVRRAKIELRWDRG